MKKKIKFLGMSVILILIMVSPLGNLKVSAHSKDGKPKPPTGIAISNAPTLALHSGHSKELISTVYNKYDSCYQVYLCKSCLTQYKIWLP